MMTPSNPLVESPATLVPAADLVHATRSVRRGEVLRLNRGVYVRRDAWTSLHPSERYLTRVHAHLLWHPDDVLCLESAAVLHGLPLLGGSHEIHVLGEHSATSRRSAGVRVHTANALDRIIEEVDGVRLVSVADTCVDLARMRHPGVALAVADAGVRRTPGLRSIDLIALNEDRSSSRGRRHARWALHRADAAAESPLESLSRAIVEWCGFCEPELQVRIGGSDRTDLWWPGRKIAGEADGYGKYDGRFGDPVEALRARNERDRRLRAAGARAVLHWTWDDVAQPAALRDLLRGAGIPLSSPPDPARLATLSSLLRGQSGRETASR